MQACRRNGPEAAFAIQGSLSKQVHRQCVLRGLSLSCCLAQHSGTWSDGASTKPDQPTNQLGVPERVTTNLSGSQIPDQTTPQVESLPPGIRRHFPSSQVSEAMPVLGEPRRCGSGQTSV